MDFKNVILLYLKFVFVSAATYEKPVHQTLRSGTCRKGDTVLNDCNWCFCDENHHYSCKTRACSGVNMFGHFNDAIRDLNVGMEGHGAWRSTATPCEPNVQYHKEGLVCICGGDGAWPNPVCRDAFRILHSVAIYDGKPPAQRSTCDALKLYLVGCNVCFCPASGKMDLALCTTKNCSINDPTLYENRVKEIETKKTEKDERALEIYAECEPNHVYQFGCQTCTCLRTNRLLCGGCNTTEKIRKSDAASFCDAHIPDQTFTVDCNVCVCDKKSLIYCTTRQCSNSKTVHRSLIPHILKESMKEVERPYDASNCVVGTKFKSGCNNCYCLGEVNGKKTYSCSLKNCDNDSDPIKALQSDCIEGTIYETMCQICQCHIFNGLKSESCYVNDECTGKKATKVRRALDIPSLHGYCEPYHTYEKDCNTCRCLPDSKTLMCTSKICKKKTRKSITVDIVPINQRNGSPCLKDRMYMVDCNICVCLSNGNILCSTADCRKSRHTRN